MFDAKALRGKAAVIRMLLHRWVTAFIDTDRLANLSHLPRFVSDWWRYRKLSGTSEADWLYSYPCLADRTSTTVVDAHYFHQACWMARKLAESAPAWHVDVGSSVEPIGAISAFVPTLFIDCRPLEVEMAGLSTMSGDVCALPFDDASVPSISCLHVLEHVGLGRYGDSIDPQGSAKAALELTRILAPGGRLLISTPVGHERVQFNAHRIFAPQTVLKLFCELELSDFAIVDDHGDFFAHAETSQASHMEYACGMFEFAKTL